MLTWRIDIAVSGGIGMLVSLILFIKWDNIKKIRNCSNLLSYKFLFIRLNFFNFVMDFRSTLFWIRKKLLRFNLINELHITIEYLTWISIGLKRTNNRVVNITRLLKNKIYQESVDAKHCNMISPSQTIIQTHSKISINGESFKKMEILLRSHLLKFYFWQSTNIYLSI